MIQKKALLLNARRKALRQLIIRNTQLYAEASLKLLNELKRLSKDDLAEFFRKNPDMLFDVGGGMVARLGSKAKTASANILKELGKDWRSARTKGSARASTVRGRLEDKGLEYLKKVLSL